VAGGNSQVLQATAAALAASVFHRAVPLRIVLQLSWSRLSFAMLNFSPEIRPFRTNTNEKTDKEIRTMAAFPSCEAGLQPINAEAEGCPAGVKHLAERQQQH
jgi:hypothetical protein